MHLFDNITEFILSVKRYIHYNVSDIMFYYSQSKSVSRGEFDVNTKNSWLIGHCALIATDSVVFIPLIAAVRCSFSCDKKQ